MNTAAYLRNRLPTSAHSITPYQRWYGRKPQLSALRVFGCTAYALIPDQQRRKLDAKRIKLTFTVSSQKRIDSIMPRLDKSLKGAM